MSQAQETQPEPSQNSGRKTKPNELNLIWVDLEMTGLDPETDRIIEVALVVTDPDLKLLHIKHAKEIKDYILKQSEQERMKRRTVNMQHLDGNPGMSQMAEKDSCR